MAQPLCLQGLRNPDSLYSKSVFTVVEHFKCFKIQLDSLPHTVLFDIYFKLYTEKRLCLLGVEFSKIEVFARMLQLTARRLDLHKSFQALMDHGTQVAKDLAISYQRNCANAASNTSLLDSNIELGLKLGGFLGDAGWYVESEKVLLECKHLCTLAGNSPKFWRKMLECCHKLLHTQAAHCNFAGATVTHKLAEEVTAKLQTAQEHVNLAGLYNEFSILHFSRSEYDEAYSWSLKALTEVVPDLHARTTIDVLRQVARSCVVKREFKKAGLLATQAVYLTKQTFSEDHPKYSDSLLDLGYYLLNYDSIRQSVTVYERALAIRRMVFGKNNLQVAVAHEDLAYALYVHEYSSGRFVKARENADKAITIMEKLLPAEHLMLSSVKRVKALILEEIALDMMDNTSRKYVLLCEAEALHQSALKLAKDTFGERNVQTAKHFGNLGRLYQSMQKYHDAELMHLKAISIKEELLGPDDYEVGLSVGHLASLYNYHMEKYQEAEKLYFRSINISLKLFGEGYSGLEYDYRGLVHVYQELHDAQKTSEYAHILSNWKLNRDLLTQKEEPNLDLDKYPMSVGDITAQFHSLN